MNSEVASPEGVRRQVEAIRNKLLDLSLRNRMLNYRPSKRLGITVLGENSFQVHRILVDEGKQMSFIGKHDPPRDAAGQQELSDFGDDVAMAEMRKAAEEELDAFLNYAPAPTDQIDTKLQTPEFESLLQLKLRTIRREANLANDELGINTLFLTLGALEWSESAERSHRAPLLYVPVTFKEQANGSLRLLHDGSDIGTNLPLRAKLAEFNIKLPELTEDKTVLDYFEEVESAIRSRTDWTLHRDEICLGFFNYEKYAMYVDLGGEAWPTDRKPWMDSDLVSMLGERFPEAISPVQSDSFIDDHRPVEDSHEVYNADSSQTLAMIRAASGISMIIEGPPGTGKSQTITNIIAEAVAAKKTVLFVAAKRAALEVVKRRLAEVELGDMCLDLHDKLTNRREFYAEIKRTANLHLHVPAQDERVRRLTELRHRLNNYSGAVNELIDPYGVAPFTAMSVLASLPPETAEDRDGRIPFDQIKAFRHPEIPQLRQILTVLEQRIRENGIPSRHPFWGASITYIDPAIRLDLEQELLAARSALMTAKASIQMASESLCIPAPASAALTKTLRLSAERALSAPPLDGVSVKAETWKQEEAAIQETIARLRRRRELLLLRGPQLTEGAWLGLQPNLLGSLERHVGKWYRFLIGEFRGARRTFQGWLTQQGPTDAEEQIKLLQDVQTVRDAEAFVTEKSAMMGRLFGVQWQGLETDPETLGRLAEWVFQLYRDIGGGSLPSGLLDVFTGAHNDPSIMAAVEKAEKDADAAVAAYRAAATTLKFEASEAHGESLDLLSARTDQWVEALPRLATYIALMESRRAAIEKGLQPAIQVADVWPSASEKLADSFVRSYYTGIVREAMESRPELRTFERLAHESAIAEFKTLDEFMLRYNRAKVRLAHYQHIPRFESAAGNLLQLKLQCELQRSHKPIRWIMARSGEAVQRIKPVFMMSPLSVAIHLPPELPPFDLVIFDEASQVKPEDALSAIIRAKQTIVVGDTRQMPPTSFFDRISDDGGEEEEEDVASEIGREAAKLESVLSLMSVAAEGDVRRPDLKWHYRSLHPSLIQPSNELFYNNRLIVFPSPGVEASGTRIGVVFHHHPETVYEGGDRKRINRMEAEIVADAVLKHVSENPGQSLMVAAMNKAQADLIYAEVQKRERLHPDPFRAFMERHPHEHLAIKNLENVQGDERDVVFISVTYGRDAGGIIRQQFGPILRDGGERRLNVLITRARQRCEVFSNITAADLRVEANQRGLHALKQYLKYAESGRMEVPIATGLAEESPFEEEVAAILRDRGYQVDAQVGTEGCRIDLAIIDPERPGQYLIGIECDGASYHSSRSARDRDKLRQSVLESRGWTLHRIWSTDWWQNKESEIARLLEAVESAGEPVERPEPEAAPVEALVETVTASPIYGSLVKPYVETSPESVANDQEMAEYLVKVVACEGPISHELLILRMRVAAGYTKTSASLRNSLEVLIAKAVNARQIQSGRECYYQGESQLTVMRDWSERPTAERRVDMISSLELEAVLRKVVEGSFGISEEEAVRAMLGQLGFRRMTDESKAKGLAVIRRMATDGKLQIEGGVVKA